MKKENKCIMNDYLNTETSDHSNYEKNINYAEEQLHKE